MTTSAATRVDSQLTVNQVVTVVDGRNVRAGVELASLHVRRGSDLGPDDVEGCQLLLDRVAAVEHRRREFSDERIFCQRAQASNRNSLAEERRACRVRPRPHIDDLGSWRGLNKSPGNTNTTQIGIDNPDDPLAASGEAAEKARGVVAELAVLNI